MTASGFEKGFRVFRAAAGKSRANHREVGERVMERSAKSSPVNYAKEKNLADAPQTYANHTRRHPPFLFFLAPVMLINVIWAIVEFVKEPTWDRGWWIVVSIALVVMAALVRANPLKAQDRIIRLEEQLRYQQLLPADLLRQTSALRVGQIVALRFASDEELAGLVREILEGRLSKPAEIKRAIKSWRADTLRV